MIDIWKIKECQLPCSHFHHFIIRDLLFPVVIACLDSLITEQKEIYSMWRNGCLRMEWFLLLPLQVKISDIFSWCKQQHFDNIPFVHLLIILCAIYVYHSNPTYCPFMQVSYHTVKKVLKQFKLCEHSYIQCTWGCIHICWSDRVSLFVSYFYNYSW